MRVAPLCIALAGLCAGCVLSTKPADDPGFANVSRLDEFQGCYENRGDSGEGAAPHYLSATIWPESGLDHKAIDAVQVDAIANEALRVSAFADRRRVRQETFVAGKDFTFDSGKITLGAKTHGSAATEPGAVFIGLTHSTTALGVDPNGNGRLQDATTMAGTVFLVIPVAARVREATRFTKAPGLCGGSVP